MNTLSVLLPVYNAHHTLTSGVEDILEVLPEVTDYFDLCILDDASTDDTAEAAHELAARYPQVRVIRHPVRLGLAEAIQTALDNTDGEIVLVSEQHYELDPQDLRALWQLRDAGRRASARRNLPSREEDRWMEKLRSWKPRLGAERGYQIIPRSVFEQFRLKQAAEMIARLDGAWSAGERRGPNFLERFQRFARNE